MTVELCEQLFLELQKIKSPILSYLNPGISKSAVDESLQLADLDIAFPAEVYSLYEWKNGIDDEAWQSRMVGELCLFKLGIFVSLNVAIVSYIKQAGQPGYWSKSLFPIPTAGKFKVITKSLAEFI